MPDYCMSTHGGAGWAPYSYWDGEVVVCGACGVRIDPSHAFGTPSWIMGVQGRAWEGDPPSPLNTKVWSTYNPKTGRHA